MVLCDIMISRKRREDRPTSRYTLHLTAFRDTDLSPVPAGQRTGGDRGGYGGDIQLLGV